MATRLYLVIGNDGQQYVEEWDQAPVERYSVCEDVGDADNYDDFAAATARAARFNCHKAAPDDYQHGTCPCPISLPPHFGCDHDAAPCQVSDR